jgi:hypothetical protein
VKQVEREEWRRRRRRRGGKGHDCLSSIADFAIDFSFLILSSFFCAAFAFQKVKQNRERAETLNLTGY